jgi:hypothetical protein
MEELLIGCSGALCKSRFWEISIDRLLFRSIDFGQSFDRSTFKFDRSTFQDLRISRHFLMKFVIPLLLTYRNRKTQKLTKTSENNKAKGLTSANQGVQIHNIWLSSSGASQHVIQLFLLLYNISRKRKQSIFPISASGPKLLK